jgi:hypothetical protein
MAKDVYLEGYSIWNVRGEEISIFTFFLIINENDEKGS